MPRRKRASGSAEVQGDDGMPPVFDDAGNILSGASEAEIATDIADAPQKPPGKRLLDKMKEAVFGGGDDDDDVPAPKARGLAKARQADFAKMFASGTALLFIWVVNANIKQEEYKPVAPSMHEASAIMEPIGRMVARRVKAAGKMSEDALDMLACATMCIMYAQRAMATQQTIKQELEGHDYATQETNRYSGTTIRYPGPYRGDARSNQAPVTQNAGHATNSRFSRQRDAAQINEPADRESHLMDELLRADAVGRIERGLS